MAFFKYELGETVGIVMTNYGYPGGRKFTISITGVIIERYRALDDRSRQVPLYNIETGDGSAISRVGEDKIIPSAEVQLIQATRGIGNE